MPTKAPQWTEYLSCPFCEKVFDEKQHCPISLGCGHTVCKVCLSGLHQMKCPLDQNAIMRDIDELPVNLALLQLVGAAVPDGDTDTKGISGDTFHYHSVKKRIEDLALYLKPAATSAGEGRLLVTKCFLHQFQFTCFYQRSNNITQNLHCFPVRKKMLCPFFLLHCIQGCYVWQQTNVGHAGAQMRMAERN